MGVGGHCHTLSALPLGKTHFPSYRRLGEPQGQSGQVKKISPPPGFDPQTIQPIASHCTEPLFGTVVFLISMEMKSAYVCLLVFVKQSKSSFDQRYRHPVVLSAV